MNFTIVAKDLGKTIQVMDRIANRIVFDNFLDLGQTALVTVASNNGTTGNIDVLKSLNGRANTYHETDYDVKSGEVMEIDD